MTEPTKYAEFVVPELSKSRLDAQWAGIVERRPGDRKRLSATVPAIGILVAACALGVVLWPRESRAPSESVWEGAVVASDDSPIEMTLAEGTHIQVEPRSEVKLLRSSSRAVQVRLGHGSARFQVSKKRTRRFSVNLGKVEVVVTGTQFRVVRKAGATGDRVQVAVEEGTVEVHREDGQVISLHAGEDWSTVVRTTTATSTLRGPSRWWAAGAWRPRQSPSKAKASADSELRVRQRRRSRRRRRRAAADSVDESGDLEPLRGTTAPPRHRPTPTPSRPTHRRDRRRPGQHPAPRCTARASAPSCTRGCRRRWRAARQRQPGAPRRQARRRRRALRGPGPPLPPRSPGLAGRVRARAAAHGLAARRPRRRAGPRKGPQARRPRRLRRRRAGAPGLGRRGTRRPRGLQSRTRTLPCTLS